MKKLPVIILVLAVVSCAFGCAAQKYQPKIKIKPNREIRIKVTDVDACKVFGSSGTCVEGTIENIGRKNLYVSMRGSALNFHNFEIAAVYHPMGILKPSEKKDFNLQFFKCPLKEIKTIEISVQGRRA